MPRYLHSRPPPDGPRSLPPVIRWWYGDAQQRKWNPLLQTDFIQQELINFPAHILLQAKLKKSNCLFCCRVIHSELWQLQNMQHIASQKSAEKEFRDKKTSINNLALSKTMNQFDIPMLVEIHLLFDTESGFFY